MRNKRLWPLGALAIAVLLAGCTGDKGDAGPAGPAGPAGTVGPAGGDGTNGTNGTNGTDGGSCTIVDNGNGTKTITCDDGTMVVVNDGTAGSSCTVADDGDGCKTITCDDGTTATVCDGQNGNPGIDPTKNYIAIHDEASPIYDDDCVSCHVGQDAEASLDPLIPGFHARKLASTVIPGTTTNEKCVYCHPKVDLTPNRSAAWARKNVDVTICSVCHSGVANKFYAAP